MRKRVRKGILCAALSASMIFSGVMVGASEKAELKSSVAEVKQESAALDTKNIAENFKKLPDVKSARISWNDPNVKITPMLVYNWATSQSLNKSLNEDGNGEGWIWGVTDNEKGGMIVRINMPRAGYLFVPIVSFKSDGKTESNHSTELYAGYATSGTPMEHGEGLSGGRSISKLARGVYTLIIKATPEQKTGYASIFPYYVTSENIGMSTGNKLVIGNGSNLYQTFKISKYRRHVWIDADVAGASYIQRYSGGSWRRVSYNNTYNARYGEMERAHYALSPGTYRFVMKPIDGCFVEFRYGTKAYSSSYATRKSKAKTLYRKKSYKTNVMTASDAKGKTHYYKIKVSKKRKTRINFVTYQNSGKFRIVVYGKGLKTKTMYVTKPSKGYVKGTLRKGTYYVKITKMTQNTSGRYSFKYAY